MNPPPGRPVPVSGAENRWTVGLGTTAKRFNLGAVFPIVWNVTGTTEYLGIPLSTLKYKLDVRQLPKRLRGV